MLNWEANFLPKPLAIPGTKLKLVEITNGYELYREGYRMRHCVVTYANRCAAGKTTIFTLMDQSANLTQHLVTARYDHGLKRVVEVHGKYNVCPDEEVMNKLYWALDQLKLRYNV